MTQEQKAKAYDEALNKAKIEINTKGIGETVNLCKQLFPELAKSDDEESEDERIRKELIGMIKACTNWAHKKEYIAYLEKQKESLPISEICKENANSFIDGIIEVRSFQRGMEEGRKLERQKEQKQAQTSEEKEYIRTIKSIISDFIRDKKPENLAYYQRIYDWLDGRHVPFSCGHENGKSTEWAELQSEFKNINEAFEDGKKEVIDHPDKYGLTKQKPADFPTTDEEVKEFLETHPKVEVPEKYKTPDFVFSKQEYESYPIISEDTTSAKLEELDGKALLYTADKSYQIGFRDGVASVKQKWSAEDEEMLEYVIGDVNDAKQLFTTKEAIDLCDKEIAWLKSLRPVKQEWSVGDEDRIRQIERIVQQAGCTQKLQEEIHNWLKSLRPVSKESLQSHWKPSEEQMDRLSSIVAALRKDYCDDMADFLASIYHNLKKLM